MNSKRKKYVPYFWIVLVCFLFMGLKGGIRVLGTLFPSDYCYLAVRKNNGVFSALCDLNGSFCQGGYNCVLKKDSVEFPDGTEGYVYWCVCENSNGETRVPRIECLEDVLISEDGSKIIEINCGKKSCPHPCYELDWEDLGDGQAAEVCSCPL